MPIVLITGANRGIGLEFVRQYAADKWNVIACCRAPADATELQTLAKTNSSVRIEALDVADDKSIAELASKLKDTPIDLLVNNAGVYSGAGSKISSNMRDKSQEFGSIDSESWMKVLRTNMIAPIMMAQAFTPHLAKGAGKQIVNITSQMGSMTEMGAGSIAYRSSKAGLNGAMRVVMHDLLNRGLSIVNFHPGWVQTDMGGKNAHLTPEQSVTHLRQTIATLKPEDTGQFLNYDGHIIPW